MPSESSRPRPLVLEPLIHPKEKIYFAICVVVSLVVYIGLALALGRAWPLILVPVPWACMNWGVIPFEEGRLTETFGEAYVDYCRRVRRWI